MVPVFGARFADEQNETCAGGQRAPGKSVHAKPAHKCANADVFDTAPCDGTVGSGGKIGHQRILTRMALANRNKDATSGEPLWAQSKCNWRILLNAWVQSPQYCRADSPL